MTLIYIPQLIETAEQAEALPIGIVAIRLDDDGHVWTAARRCRCQKPGCDAWFSTDWGGPRDHAHVVGADVLVPIEAHTQDPAPIPGWGEHVRRHRYVTEWRYGPPPDRRGDCA